MALEIKNEKKIEYPRIGEGTYMARVVNIIDLGKHVKTDYKTGQVVYKDNEKVIEHRVFIQFELPSEKVVVDGEERPRWLAKEYNLSFFEKSALHGLIQATSYGRKFKTLNEMLGQPLMVSIGTTSGGKDKVVGVAPMMKGMQVPELENPSKVFDMDDPDMEVWEKLPNFIKEKITESIDFDGSELAAKLANTKANEESSDEDLDDDIPF